MVFSIIQKSQLEGVNRIDAEYYQPEYLEKIAKLKSTQTVRLSDIAYITDGEHGSPIWDENSGIKYYSAQHVRDGIIDNSEAQTISKVIDDRNKRSRLQKGDILISTVGTIGFAGLVTEDLLPANIDRHVGRICLKPNTLDPEFLVIFLNSSFGRFQSFRNSTGNVQLNLFIEKIKEFLVPRNNNSQISQLFKSSLRGSKSSSSLYSQAENLLLKELGLKDYKVEDDLYYIVNLSDTKFINRIDSDYYQPKYDRIISLLNKSKIGVLNNNFEIIRSKNFHYKEEGDIGVVQTKQLGKQFINFDFGEKTSYEILEKEKLPTVMDKDVLFASMGVGSLGKTNIFYKFESGNTFTIDSTLKIFRKKFNGKLLPEVLCVYFNSFIGQELIYKYIVGSSGIISIYDKYLENFILPIISETTQQKIVDLVRQSHEARKKSKELLEEAKRKVEEIIEKGGEN